MHREPRVRAFLSVFLALTFLAALVPSAQARSRRDNGRGAYGFEREARQLGRILGIDPWTAAELIQSDKELRFRAGPAIDAERRRRAAGTGLTIPGAILTVVGAIVTSVASNAYRGCTWNCDTVAYHKALGVGIGFLATGVGLAIPGIVLLATPSSEARHFTDWYNSRQPSPATPDAPAGVEPDDETQPPPEPEPATSLVPVRRELRGPSQGGAGTIFRVLSVPF